MSQDNVEIVRSVYSLGGGRMFSEETEAAIAPPLERLFDPRFEFIPPPIYPDTEARYVGLDGLRRFQQQMDEVWEDWRFETVRLLDAGEHVVVFLSVSGTARASRAPVTMPIAHVVGLQAGSCECGRSSIAVKPSKRPALRDRWCARACHDQPIPRWRVQVVLSSTLLAVNPAKP